MHIDFDTITKESYQRTSHMIAYKYNIIKIENKAGLYTEENEVRGRNNAWTSEIKYYWHTEIQNLLRMSDWVPVGLVIHVCRPIRGMEHISNLISSSTCQFYKSLRKRTYVKFWIYKRYCRVSLTIFNWVDDFASKTQAMITFG